MSTENLRFETPENVPVQYQLAGLGTRFLAWFVDQVLLSLLLLGVIVVLMCAGASTEGVFTSLEMTPQETADAVFYYFAGVMILVWGLGSFAYFGLSELFCGGQTIGKRITKIRVVKADGFALDAASILIRNLFRVADHLSPLWIVPLLSRRSQRLGDMVAGTVVVADNPSTLTSVRTRLAERTAAQAEFRFDHAALGRLATHDIEAVERFLERWDDLPEAQRAALVERLVSSLAEKLRVTPPPPDRRIPFLEDLLAAEYRRQNRALG